MASDVFGDQSHCVWSDAVHLLWQLLCLSNRSCGQCGRSHGQSHGWSHGQSWGRSHDQSHGRSHGCFLVHIQASLRLRTCQAAYEPLLSVLVEQVRAEDQLQALVARLSSARRQHLIQQHHLLVTNPTDTCQGVFYQTQDLPDDGGQKSKYTDQPLNTSTTTALTYFRLRWLSERLGQFSPPA